jgi:hypothetical protein
VRLSIAGRAVRDFRVPNPPIESAPRVDLASLRLRVMLGQETGDVIRSVRGIEYRWAGDAFGDVR